MSENHQNCKSKPPVALVVPFKGKEEQLLHLVMVDHIVSSIYLKCVFETVASGTYATE